MTVVSCLMLSNRFLIAFFLEVKQSTLFLSVIEGYFQSCNIVIYYYYYFMPTEDFNSGITEIVRRQCFRTRTIFQRLALVDISWHSFFSFGKYCAVMSVLFLS